MEKIVQSDINTNKCNICNTNNSIRYDKKEISIDDKKGSYKTLTLHFCEECGDIKDFDLS